MLCNYYLKINKYEKGGNSHSSLGSICLTHILLDINETAEATKNGWVFFCSCWLPHVVSVVGKENPGEAESRETRPGWQGLPKRFMCSEQLI